MRRSCSKAEAEYAEPVASSVYRALLGSRRVAREAMLGAVCSRRALGVHLSAARAARRACCTLGVHLSAGVHARLERKYASMLSVTLQYVCIRGSY